MLAPPKRQAEERESFMVEKGFSCALIQGYLYGEDVGGLTRSGASYVIWLQVPIGFFPGWSQVRSGDKN